MLQTVQTTQCDDIQKAAEGHINGTADHVQTDEVKPTQVTKEDSVEKVVQRKNEQGNYM